MAALIWSARARRDVANLLTWYTTNRGSDIAEAVRAAIHQAAAAAAARPLAYVWVGSVLPYASRSDRGIRRVLAWRDRLHVIYRYLEAEDRIVIMHVRDACRRPISLNRLADLPAE